MIYVLFILIEIAGFILIDVLNIGILWFVAVYFPATFLVFLMVLRARKLQENAHNDDEDDSYSDESTRFKNRPKH